MLCKLAGALLLFVGCSGWGFSYARTFSKRVEELEALEGLFAHLEGEIRYALRPLPSALEELGNYPLGQLFAETAAQLQHSTELTASRAYLHALHGADLHLKKEDYRVLESLAPSLGICDHQTQQDRITALRKRLELQSRLAREDCGKYQRLAGCLGVLGGVFLLILLL